MKCRAGTHAARWSKTPAEPGTRAPTVESRILSATGIGSIRPNQGRDYIKVQFVIDPKPTSLR
jgi:hypothetical protein